MDEQLRPLFDLAFDSGPATEANARIQAARQAVDPTAAKVRNYEVVVPGDAGLAWLETTLLPRLVYHLESLGARPPQAAGVFVAFFLGEELRLVHARDLFAFASAALGLDAEEMLRRWGTGESRTALRDPPAAGGPPLALPGPQRR